MIGRLFRVAALCALPVSGYAGLTPTINWTNPVPITYGTRIVGNNQYNATATYAGTNVPGTFTYSPARGAVLPTGTNILTGVFVPTDTTTYNSSTNTVSLLVLPAPLTVTAINVAITNGQATPAFTDTVMYLKNNDAIIITNYCSATTNSPVGSYPIIPALIDPNNLESNYTVTLVNGTLFVVAPGTLVAWSSPSNVNYGTVLSSNQLNALALVSGTLVYTPSYGAVPVAGTNLLSVVLTPTDTVDYSTTTDTVSLVVLPIPLTVTASNSIRGAGQTNATLTGTVVGLTNGDPITVSYTCSATVNSPAGTYPIVPVISDPSGRLPNYSVTISNGVLTVTNAAPGILSVPTNQVVSGGKTVSFRVTAVGTSPLSYQWNLNGTNLTDNGQTTGSQSNILTLTNVQPANAGSYQVVITNPYGTTNASANLVVLTVGAWTPLTHSAPGGIGTMLLLSDGTVMAQDSGGGTSWYHLSPDTNGSYVNGKWTQDIPAMHCARLYYSSDVMLDGRLFVAGGEYGVGTTNAEIYDPVAKTWTMLNLPPGLITTLNVVQSDGGNSAGFLDSGSVLLASGKILITPVFPASYGKMLVYDPVANSWTNAMLYRGSYEDEASMATLPDNSVLVVDFNSQNSERYIPFLNKWVNDAVVPVQLYDSYGDELGATFLLPNGNAFVIGSNPHYAIYTPSGTTSPGSWAGGPLPNNLGAPDAPAAMMANGKVLCALSPAPTSANHFPSPTYFYEFDYTLGALGSFLQTSAPTGGSNINSSTYVDRMLDLPDGTVLFTTSDSQLYVYTPYGPPLAAGQPVIQSITPNPDGSFLLAGTGLNGISQGAGYGDDAQMNSNFPLVRMTNNATGMVYYGRTYNWSSGAVMTGTNILTTQFVVPANVPVGMYSLAVVANGNPSSAFAFTVFRFSYVTNAGAITITGYAGPGGVLAIPSSINGLPVAAISNDAFAGNTNLTSITIPASVTSIGSSAFVGNTRLTSVYFTGNPPAADSSAFASDSLARGYYLPRTTGWPAFATATGLPTLPWDPLGSSGGMNFNVQSNSFGFSFTGPAGLNIVLQATTNALGAFWVPLQTNTLSGGLFNFSEPLLTNAPSRYYRITSQ